MNLKNNTLLLLYKPTKKGKSVHIWKCHVRMTKKEENLLIWKCHVAMAKKGKKLLLWKCHVTMAKKQAYISNQLPLHIYSSTFIHKKIFSFSYQHSISFTHDSQHYCFLRQTILCQLRRLQQMAEQIWAIFLVQKRFQLLGCKTQSIQERWQERVDWPKILQWEKQISTSLCDWGISWSMQQKILLERKIWPQCWYLQCPETWMNNSNWLTRESI